MKDTTQRLKRPFPQFLALFTSISGSKAQKTHFTRQVPMIFGILDRTTDLESGKRRQNGTLNPKHYG